MSSPVVHKRTASGLGRCFPRLLFKPRLSGLILTIYVLIFFFSILALISKMRVKQYLPAALSAMPAFAQGASPGSGDTVDPFEVYTISAENITAKLIPYGARLVSLLVPDRSGTLQDVVVGFDDPLEYLHNVQTDNAYLGPVVGRYANRIKNGTFKIDGTEYHIGENENGGIDALHGGPVGYDQHNWTVTSHSKSAITFTLRDYAYGGFPGDTITHATYAVDTSRTPANPDGLPQLLTRLVSISMTTETPIMLANHIYWNLNAFKEANVLSDILHLPLSKQYVGTDGDLVPNGAILDVAESDHGVMDFTSGKAIGRDLRYAEGVCGTQCIGYDNCFITGNSPWYSSPDPMAPILKLQSNTTGITLEVSTNQPALQIYTCNGMKGTIPVRPSQVKRNVADGKGGAKFINKHGCIVIETEGWIDGINQPQWGQNSSQIFTPQGFPAVNLATYRFGIVN